MRVALAIVALLAGGYTLGRWWFDDRAPGGAGSHRLVNAAPASAPLGRPEPGQPAPAARGARLPVASASLVAAAPAPAPAADDVLEAMMIGHRDAMLMLREAIHHQLFYRGSALAACGDPAADRVVCWVRFQGTLHGPWMEPEPESVDCGGRSDPVLVSCILDRLVLRDPLGIPAEAAAELGDYAGPIDVPLTWDPE
jgi:hypothetical protein